MQLRTGIYVNGDWEYLAATIDSLHGSNIENEIAVIVDQHTVIPESLPEHINQCVTISSNTAGEAGAFNTLLQCGEADAYLWLECGVRLGFNTIDILLHALKTSPAGIVGPSTNLSWNEQGAAKHIPVTSQGYSETLVKTWADKYEGQSDTLSPLFSLGCFCMMLSHETIQTVGAADERFGEQPCWEMDYNIRAARAGIDGLWVKSALVYRPLKPFSSKNAELLEDAKKTYQDKHCALQKGAGQPYHSHCKGDVCEHFATDTIIKIAFDEHSAQSSDAAPISVTEPATSHEQQPTFEIIPAKNQVDYGSELPVVSCVLPTYNRAKYLPMAIALFLKQDFTGAELVIVDDGSEPVHSLIPEHPLIKYYYLKGKVTLGEKRNICCDLARGQIIIHWDDDDWFAYWRISYQVANLLQSGKHICGVNSMYYANPTTSEAWIYAYPPRFGNWIAGGSFCYHKAFWQQHPFPALNDGEDTQMITQVAGSDIHILDRFDFYVGRVHNQNTSEKKTSEILWHSQPISTIESIIGDDYPLWSA